METNLIKEITQTIFELIGNEYLYFDSPVTVKITPHTPYVNIWAACVSPAGDLFVMDANQEWTSVTNTDQLIIASLYQRIKIIHSKYQTQC